MATRCSAARQARDVRRTQQQVQREHFREESRGGRGDAQTPRGPEAQRRLSTWLTNSCTSCTARTAVGEPRAQTPLGLWTSGRLGVASSPSALLPKMLPLHLLLCPPNISCLARRRTSRCQTKPNSLPLLLSDVQTGSPRAERENGALRLGAELCTHALTSTGC